MNNSLYLPTMYEDPVHSLHKLAEITKQLSVKRQRSRRRISQETEPSDESYILDSEDDEGEVQIAEQADDPLHYVQEVKIVGVHKKERPRRSYLFVVLVKWTDGSHVIVYRRLSEVRAFQENLLNVTRNENLTEETKYLKKLTKDVRKASQVVNGSMQRLRMIDSLNRYLDAVTYYKKLAQSETVTEFLRPSENDLNSSLWSGQGRTFFYIARDILGHRNPALDQNDPDTDLTRLSSQTLSQLPYQETTGDFSVSCETDDPNISWPLHSEIFVALCAMVPTKDDKEQNIIGLRKGENVEVLNQHDCGWWLVKRIENEGNNDSTEMDCGYVPATYLAPKGFHVDSPRSVDDIEFHMDDDDYVVEQECCSYSSSDEDVPEIENIMAPRKKCVTRQNTYESIQPCTSTSPSPGSNWVLESKKSDEEQKTNFPAEVAENLERRKLQQSLKEEGSPAAFFADSFPSGSTEGARPLIRRQSTDGILTITKYIAPKKPMQRRKSTFEFYPKSRPLINRQATARSLSVLARLTSLGSTENSSSSQSSSSSSGNAKKRLEYISKKKYKAERPDELSFEANAIISVQKKNSNGWWLARYQGKEGLVPAVYLTKYNDPLKTLGMQVLGLL